MLAAAEAILGPINARELPTGAAWHNASTTKDATVVVAHVLVYRGRGLLLAAEPASPTRATEAQLLPGGASCHQHATFTANHHLATSGPSVHHGRRVKGDSTLPLFRHARGLLLPLVRLGAAKCAKDRRLLPLYAGISGLGKQPLLPRDRLAVAQHCPAR